MCVKSCVAIIRVEGDTRRKRSGDREGEEATERVEGAQSVKFVWPHAASFPVSPRTASFRAPLAWPPAPSPPPSLCFFASFYTPHLLSIVPSKLTPSDPLLPPIPNFFCFGRRDDRSHQTQVATPFSSGLSELASLTHTSLNHSRGAATGLAEFGS